MLEQLMDDLNYVSMTLKDNKEMNLFLCEAKHN